MKGTTLGLQSTKARFNLPLLIKELVEQAARKRTYVLRVVYALGLFLLGGGALQELFNRSGGDYMNMLGQGSQVFGMVVVVEMAGIYLFLPAMMAGAITQEKERDSLVLLLLTDLRPWEIILQKYLGRLIPMLTFVLLALPVMAVAFSFGGIELSEVALWSWVLLLTILQVGAAALAASAFCRSTASAFVLTYVLLGALYAGPVLIWGIFALTIYIVSDEAAARLAGDRWAILLGAMCPWLMSEVVYALSRVAMWRNATTTWMSQLLLWALASLPTLISVAGLLIAARVFLLKRAFLPPKNFVMQVFRLFDVWMNYANRLTGGVVLIPDHSTLPGDKPVAWLEVAKRATGKARYLIRVLALTYIPVLFVTTLVLAYRRSGAQSHELSVMLMLVWAVAVLLLAMQGSSAISSERRRQTLDVLLTTPMTGREIVQQKMAPLWRLMLVLLIPFLTVIIVEAWWESELTQRRIAGWATVTHVPLYLFCSLLSLVVYLPLIAYTAMLLGMRIGNQTRAIMATIMVVLGWIFLPLLGLLIAEQFGLYDSRFSLPALTSPAMILAINETSDWNILIGLELGALDSMLPHFALVAGNFLVYGSITLLMRYWCLRQADHLLGRPTSVVERQTIKTQR